MRFGSLFSGIGGIDLGLERAGFEPVWQVEIDDYATKVLEKHWPSIPRSRDVREFGAEHGAVDLIAGGFPCQDISSAGKRAGISGSRSGLWREMVRTIRMVRPKVVLVENVAALLNRGIGTVLGDLAESGYDSEWDCLSACEFGALHTRERVFVVAHAKGNMGKVRLGPRNRRETKCRDRETNAGYWRMEPFTGIRGVASGIPSRVDRLRCLGNAVVPQVAEWIGKQILTALDRAE